MWLCNNYSIVIFLGVFFLIFLISVKHVKIGRKNWTIIIFLFVKLWSNFMDFFSCFNHQLWQRWDFNHHNKRWLSKNVFLFFSIPLKNKMSQRWVVVGGRRFHLVVPLAQILLTISYRYSEWREVLEHWLNVSHVACWLLLCCEPIINNKNMLASAFEKKLSVFGENFQ